MNERRWGLWAVLLCAAAAMMACSPTSGRSKSDASSPGTTGGSSGGTTGGTSNTTGAMDVSGAWAITETVKSASGVCAESIGSSSSYTVNVSQNGSSLTVTVSTLPGQSFSGSLSGSTLSWTGSYAEPSGGTSTITSMSLTVSGNSLSGNSNWSWSGSGESCTGASSFTGTRSGGGTTGGTSGGSTGGSTGGTSGGTTGGTAGPGCTSLCNSIYANGEPSESFVNCTASKFAEAGVPIQEICDEPHNASDCISCVGQAGVSDSLCQQVTSGCSP